MENTQLGCFTEKLAKCPMQFQYSSWDFTKLESYVIYDKFGFTDDSHQLIVLERPDLLAKKCFLVPYGSERRIDFDGTSVWVCSPENSQALMDALRDIYLPALVSTTEKNTTQNYIVANIVDGYKVMCIFDSVSTVSKCYITPKSRV